MVNSGEPVFRYKEDILLNNTGIRIFWNLLWESGVGDVKKEWTSV